MRQRSGTPLTNSSGLVPMADMLSNTVGIMLFILAFTVLQTGGVLIPKRLPMEQKTDERPLYYVCWEQRLMPLDTDLSANLSEGLGKPTYNTVEEWVAKFNKARAEDQFFSVLPDGEARFKRGAFESSVRLVLSVEYTPKDNVGDTIETLDRGGSLFDKHLRSLPKNERFVYFFVYPGSIDLFRKAREYAEVRYGIGSGWGPVSVGKPIRFNLGGGGRGIIPKKQ